MNTHDETLRYESLLKLSPAQTVAVDVLDAGGSQLDAAAKAGVSRVTISRWTHHHPAFVAELNRRCIERAGRVAAQSDELIFKAMELVAQAIDQGDVTVAVQVLRILGPVTPEIRSRRMERPISAEEIIARDVGVAAMNAPLELVSDPYRNVTVKKIAALLAP